ncbi:hypothetical protein ABW19_dt0205824 [Dactylella cylindrospora]|nr:hypothetical protein ABW19_dt0205824 [Dactylella cylindrospora]
MPNRKIDNYTLTVTAGPSRDPSTHKPVPVNTEKPLHFDTEHITTDLYIRIQGFRSDDELPTTSPYFTTPPHSTNKDKYSISFSPLTFKNSINGDDLVLGNDFDKPIRQNLPPGFNLAWKIARWVVDPGLDGDPWADKPYMEGRVLSSVNVVDVGERAVCTAGEGVDVLEEGLSKRKVSTVGANGDYDSGEEEIPKDSAGRMKYFVNEEKRKVFTFEKGEKYWTDFFNPYIDFNEFALNLPGVSIHILQYWDGQPLRYVLKNRVDQTVYLVIQFTLTPKENEDEDEDEEDEEDDTSSDDEFEDAPTSKLADTGTSQDDVD